MKEFYIQYNIGKVKYVVNHNDGNKKHKDGSRFFDIATFKNKKNLAKFVSELKNKSYVERSGWHS